MGMGCIRGNSLIGSMCPIRVGCMGVDRFSIGSVIVMIISEVWWWGVVKQSFPIKGVSE